MVLQVQIKVVGSEETLNKLRKVGVQLNNFSTEFRKSGEFLVSFFSNEVFETQGQIIGESWKSLTPAVEFKKRIEFPGRGILERTGHMRKSFKAISSSTFLKIFNPVSYFKYHQSGKPRTKLPRRVMLKMDRQRVDEVISIIQKGLLGRIRSAIR